jgi:hypothetical protein
MSVEKLIHFDIFILKNCIFWKIHLPLTIFLFFEIYFADIFNIYENHTISSWVNIFWLAMECRGQFYHSHDMTTLKIGHNGQISRVQFMPQFTISHVIPSIITFYFFCGQINLPNIQKIFLSILLAESYVKLWMIATLSKSQNWGKENKTLGMTMNSKLLGHKQKMF